MTGWRLRAQALAAGLLSSALVAGLIAVAVPLGWLADTASVRWSMVLLGSFTGVIVEAQFRKNRSP